MFGTPNKYVLLGILVVQGATTTVLSRYTRSVPREALYSVNHLILITEMGKIILNLVLEIVLTANVRPTQFWHLVRQHNITDARDAIKLAIPALLYFVQNTCTYTALTHLSAPVFQVLYQSKLLTTAAVSVALLGRTYSLTQWMSLAVLSLGVAVAVSSEVKNKKDVHNETDDSISDTTETDDRDDVFQEQIAFVGIVAVVVATFCSALAGVYFEKIVKTPTSDKDAEKPSLYMRNTQLAFFSVLVGLAQLSFVVHKNRNNETQQQLRDAVTTSNSSTGFLHGFSPLVWTLVVLQATLGLVASGVMKYADNVMKGVATGSMVLLATILSHFLLHTNVTPLYAIGAVLIIASSFVFANPTSDHTSVQQRMMRCDEDVKTCSTKTRNAFPWKALLMVAFVGIAQILYASKNVYTTDANTIASAETTKDTAKTKIPLDCPLVFNSSGVECYPPEHVVYSRSVVTDFPKANFKFDTTRTTQPKKESCALVLSSGALLKHEDGDLIDSYDEIIRFNSAPVAGYEKYAGSRTTYMSFNMNPNPVYDMISWAREHQNDTVPAKLIGQPILWGMFKEFPERLRKVRNFYPGESDFLRFDGLDVMKGVDFCKAVMASSFAKFPPEQICTSGMLLTLWAMDKCEAVTIFGANQDSCYPHHYWDNVTSSVNNCTNQFYKDVKLVWHDMGMERKLQIQLHKEGRLFINRPEELPPGLLSSNTTLLKR